MKIITDSVQVQGGAEYTFVCSRIPFAVSCTSTLPAGAYNYMDLDLVNQMRIPLLNIKVTKMYLHGRNVRSVGSISQTVQCVHNGKVQGTVHLEAKVIRNLNEMFNVDCIASRKTFSRLTGRAPPEPPDFPDDQVPEPVHDVVLGGHEEEDLDLGEPRAPDDPDPPDPKLSALGSYKDLDDALAKAPWSRQCVPRGSPMCTDPYNSQGEEEDNDDNIRAAAHGYPDRRYANLGSLGPTDHQIALANQEDDEDEEDDTGAAAHGYPPLPQLGKDHAPHVLPPSMRNQPVDPFFAEHGRYKSQMLPANTRGKKYCRMCVLSKQTPAVYLSHNTLDPRCPSTSDQDKERIRRKMEDGN